MQLRLGIVILAAGASERYGDNKLLSRHPGGTSLIMHTVRVCQPLCTFGSPVVVSGRWHDSISRELHSETCQVLYNLHWQQGMGKSIACGVKGVIRHDSEKANTTEPLDSPTHILIVLGDLPLISTRSLCSLTDAAQRFPDKIISSGWEQKTTVPAIFPVGYFSALQLLNSDEGAKHILKKTLSEHPQDIITVPHTQAGVDIDTPSDWLACRADIARRI